jgi:predicted RNA binding protein YcfA (HicA-like mRNA interferase family)
VLRLDALSKLPTQLKWRQFVAVLKVLGYEQLRSKGGSARHFQRGTEDPVTFHEPHGSDTLRQGTLTEYLRKLGVTRDQFEAVLSGFGNPIGDQMDEERYRRTARPDGVIVSNCLLCFSVVAQSSSEDEVSAAEAAHSCNLALAAMA